MRARRTPGLVKIRAVPLLRRRAVSRIVADPGPTRDVVAPCARGVSHLVEVVARLARGDLRVTRGSVDDETAPRAGLGPRDASAAR